MAVVDHIGSGADTALGAAKHIEVVGYAVVVALHIADDGPKGASGCRCSGDRPVVDVVGQRRELGGDAAGDAAQIGTGVSAADGTVVYAGYDAAAGSTGDDAAGVLAAAGDSAIVAAAAYKAGAAGDETGDARGRAVAGRGGCGYGAFVRGVRNRAAADLANNAAGVVAALAGDSGIIADVLQRAAAHHSRDAAKIDVVAYLGCHRAAHGEVLDLRVGAERAEEAIALVVECRDLAIDCHSLAVAIEAARVGRVAADWLPVLGRSVDVGREFGTGPRLGCNQGGEPEQLFGRANLVDVVEQFGYSRLGVACRRVARWRVAGWRVTGWRVTGWRVACWRVACWRVACRRVVGIGKKQAAGQHQGCDYQQREQRYQALPQHPVVFGGVEPPPFGLAATALGWGTGMDTAHLA